MKISRDFWKGKRVLVTGHTGFKGTWLTLLLEELGCEVCGISNANMNCIYAPKSVHVNDLDFTCISDVLRFTECVQIFKPDIFIHLAAQPLVGEAARFPGHTLLNNYVANAVVLELLKCYQINNPNFYGLFITTDKVYADPSAPAKETDVMWASEPYAASKVCCEILNETYAKNYLQYKIGTARAGNVFGGGDWSEGRVFADILKAFTDGTKMTIKTPEAVRPWQHILCCLEGYLLMIQEGYGKEEVPYAAYNFGPAQSDCWTVREIVAHIGELFADHSWHELGKNIDEKSVLYLDSSKAHSNLGWEPKWNIKDSIEKFVEWMTCYNEDGGGIVEFTKKQIQEYLK